MQVFLEKLSTDQAFFLLAVIVMVLFLLLLINLIMIFGLKKKLKLVTHNQDGMNIETIINQYYTDVEEVKSTQGKILINQEEINLILQRCLSKVGVIRFNPFSEVGGDQSFAIALLDRDNNGVVISSLYNRENCRFYGKPIVNGHSSYQLSDEEGEAIKRAIAEKDGN